MHEALTGFMARLAEFAGALGLPALPDPRCMTLLATYPASVAVPAGEVRRTPYRPELDVLRFMAFFLVFLHHILPRHESGYPAFYGSAAGVLASIGNLCGYGLSLFFALSAFLITDLLMREKAQTGYVHLRDFYVRRVLRIWPLYFFGLLLGWLHYAVNRDPADALMLTMFMLMAGNWFFQSGQWSSNPATPLWSISIEEQFYLVWPMAMKLLGRSGIYAACGVLTAVAIGVEFYFGETHAAVDTTVWTNTFVQFQTFAAGAALAIYLNGGTVRLSVAARAALMACGFALWFVAVDVLQAKQIGLAQSGPMLAGGIGVSVFGSLAIIVSMVGAQINSRNVLVYLGKVSFGLYVFHLLFIDMANKIYIGLVDSFYIPVSPIVFSLLAIFPTILAAHFSYRLLETPFLRLKERFTFVTSRPV